MHYTQPIPLLTPVCLSVSLSLRLFVSFIFFISFPVTVVYRSHLRELEDALASYEDNTAANAVDTMTVCFANHPLFANNCRKATHPFLYRLSPFLSVCL